MVIQLSDFDHQETDGLGFTPGFRRWEPKAVRHGLEITLPGLVAILGTAFFIGWISSAGYFQVAKHWDQSAKLKTVETQTIPALKSLAGCQEHRSDVLAGQVADPNGLPECPRLPPPKSVLHAAIPVPK